MKILLINNFHYRFGGASVVYLNTAEILQKQGHEVVFFSIKDEINLPTDNEIYFIDRKIHVGGKCKNKIENVKNYFYNRQSSVKLELLLKTEKPDIAHIHLFYGGITSSILPVLKRHNIPIVHTAHDYRLICPAYTFLDASNNICESCKMNKFYMCAVKKCSKNSFLQSLVMSIEMYYRNIFFNPLKYIDGFIFVSNFSRKKHIEYNPNFLGKSILTLYNSTTQEFNSNTISDYFLFYGRISAEKGILTLINSMDANPTVKLKIVGTGPQKEFLEIYTKKRKLSNVEFIGFKSGDELKDIVSNAKFIVVPSEWYENNPLTIVEAYSCGKPVIGADIAGISEIVIDGKTGFTFKSRDSIDLSEKIKKASIISDIDYISMCDNAFRFALENFNSSVNYNRLIDFYRLIISQNKNEKLT